MANGEEDLREKNKDSAPLSQKYDDWRVGQGGGGRGHASGKTLKLERQKGLERKI